MVSLLGYRVIDLQAAGFEIWPTFRTPHVTIAFTGDLDERLAALVRAAHEVRTNPYLSPTTNRKGELVAATEVDLIVDLNTMDDTGLPWAFLDEAPDPACIRPGRHLLVGSGATRGIALVVDITDGHRSRPPAAWVSGRQRAPARGSQPPRWLNSRR